LASSDSLIAVNLSTFDVLKQVTGIQVQSFHYNPSSSLILLETCSQGLLRFDLNTLCVIHSAILTDATCVALSNQQLAWADDFNLFIAPLNLPPSFFGAPSLLQRSSSSSACPGSPSLGLVQEWQTQISGRLQISNVSRSTDATIPPGCIHRQMIFVDSDPDSIQSECLLVNGEPLPSHLVFLVHRCLAFALECSSVKMPKTVAVIGLGTLFFLILNLLLLQPTEERRQLKRNDNKNRLRGFNFSLACKISQLQCVRN